MKISLSVLLFCLPFALIAQNEGQSGIRFENLPTWNAVLAKAKQEGKYVFVDCFTTWCGPCKRMDKDIYPIDSIGKFFDEHFISIKVQMDSSATADNEAIRSWYADAHQIQREYKVSSFPSYLFFSPDGKLVHRSMAYKDSKNFSILAHNAIDPQKQYYTRLEKFHQGTLAYSDMPEVVAIAERLQDTNTAVAVAKTYINSYLLELPEKDLYTYGNIVFIGTHLQGSKDRAFQLFYLHGARVDSAIKTPNYARNSVDLILEREEIDQVLYAGSKPFRLRTGEAPDWNRIERSIKKKYNADYAGRVVLWAKIKWLEYKKDWPQYCNNVILKVEKYGPYYKYGPFMILSEDTRFNSSAWEIFSYSTDRGQLEKALAWSEKVIKNTPEPNSEYFDTYANLLYKLGRKEEALAYEEKAIALNPKAEDIAGNLAKIKKGEPTWPNE